MNSFSSDPTKRFRNKPKRRANPQAMAGRPQNKPKPEDKIVAQHQLLGANQALQGAQRWRGEAQAHSRAARGLSDYKSQQDAESAALRAGLQGTADPMARPVGTDQIINRNAMAGRPTFDPVSPVGGGAWSTLGSDSSFTTSNTPTTQIDSRNISPASDSASGIARFGNQNFHATGSAGTTSQSTVAAEPQFHATGSPATGAVNPLAMAARPDVASVVPPIANPDAMAARPDVAPVTPPVANVAAMADRPDMPGDEPASAMDSPLQMQAEANRKALNAGLADPYGRDIQAIEPQEAQIEESPSTALGPYTQGDRVESYGAIPEPPSVDPFRAQLQQAIQGRLGADPYAARQAAAEADYQVQADKAREALSERLNRLGVLRGGGATASQFGEFESGVLRGQQALGAQYEGQRQAGIEKAIEQGIGMYEAGGRQDISREQQRMQEIEMFGGEAGPEGRGTLARRLGVGGMDLQAAQLEEQRQSRLQRGTEGALERDLSREELYGGVTRPVDRASTLAARESVAQRGLQERELTQRGTLAAADIESREGLAREDRLLGREELYGSGDVSRQQGSTLASRELAQRGDIAAEQARLEEVNIYGRTLSDAERSMIEAGRGGPSTVAARDLTQRGAQFDKELSSREQEAGFSRDLAREELYGGPQGMVDQRAGTLAAQDARSNRQLQREDLALRQELGRGQLAQDTRRTDLARTELYGQDVSGMSPMQIQALGGTLGAREAREGRALEERRLDEVELAGREGRALAQTELYGQDISNMSPMQIQALGGTLAAREGAAERTSREGMAARDITSREGMATAGRKLAREELYGTGDVTQHMGDTLASSVAAREQADRATALGYEGRRVREQEQAGRETRDIQRREQRYREDQRGIDNALLALGLTQTSSGTEGYMVSDEEKALVQSLLGPYAPGSVPQVPDQSDRIGTESSDPYNIRADGGVVDNNGIVSIDDEIYRHPDDPNKGRFAGLETIPEDDLVEKLTVPYVNPNESRMDPNEYRQRRDRRFHARPSPTSRLGQYGLTYSGT